MGVHNLFVQANGGDEHGCIVFRNAHDPFMDYDGFCITFRGMMIAMMIPAAAAPLILIFNDKPPTQATERPLFTPLI
jgi:predicted metal-binding membrane protein